MEVLTEPRKFYKVGIIQGLTIDYIYTLNATWQSIPDNNKVLIHMTLPPGTNIYTEDDLTARADTAVVDSIERFSDGSKVECGESLFAVYINRHRPFLYKRGKTVNPNRFSIFKEVSGAGIHGFFTEEAARSYGFRGGVVQRVSSLPAATRTQ